MTTVPTTSTSDAARRATVAASSASSPAPALLARLTDPKVLATLAAFLVAFLFYFRFWIFQQVRYADRFTEDWGHTVLIPLICLYLLWQNRDGLERARFKPFWPGVVPVVVGLYSYLFFVVGVPNHLGQGLAMVLTLFGLVLLVLGASAMRYLFLPLAYMVFAITLPESWMIKMTFPLQLLASKGSYILLSIFGVGVTLEGNVLNIVGTDGTVVPLNVAEQCSGMRTLVSFIALGAVVSLVATRAWWKRIVLMAMAIPVALVLNVLRVAVLTYLAKYDASLSQGEAHTLIGMLLLVPGFLAYLGIVWALNKAVPEEEPPAAGSSPAPQPERSSPGRRPMDRSLVPAVAAGLALLVSSSALFGVVRTALKAHLVKEPINAPGGRQVSAIPVETQSWIRHGADRREAEVVEGVLGTANYLNRIYVKKSTIGTKDEQFVDLHLAYYTGMIDTVPHVPERCMVGGGWSILGSTAMVPMNLDRMIVLPDSDVPESLGAVWQARITTPGGEMAGARVRLPQGYDKIALRVTPFASGDGRAKLYAGYFFIANGGVADNAEQVRLLAFDLRSKYAYFLKVQVSSPVVESPEELGVLAEDLLSELLPEIMLCVPDWIDVQLDRYPAPAAGEPNS